MKNFKLILRSLVSNDAAIEGAIKRPWYFAIIIFFFSIILSVVPATTLELKKQGDKNFDGNTFLTAEAVTEFAEELQKPEYNDIMYVVKEGKTSYLYSNEFEYKRNNEQKGSPDFVFSYVSNENLDGKLNEYQANNLSYFVFTRDTVYISIRNPGDPSSNPVLGMTCINAYKKVSENQIKETFAQKTTKNETCDATWANWKYLIKKLYNQTRLKTAGLQLAIVSSVNVGISLIMGFMVWILTRGKANAYRALTAWDGFKIAFWAGLFPGALTCGFGFLFKGFASALFPLLLGVRVMWLSMKSLRPDGSGYKLD